MAAMRRALAGHRESAMARSIHRAGAVLVSDADDAEHWPEAHLGLWVLGHGASRDLCDMRPELASPLGHPLWRPLAIVLVLERTVLGVCHRGTGTCVAAAV